MTDSNDPTNSTFVAGDAQLVFESWREGPYHARQQAFDLTDYPLIMQTIGCILDSQP